MQHIVAGDNIVRDDITLGHPLINIPRIHLQNIGNAAHTEDNEVKYLKVHNLLFRGKDTTFLRTKQIKQQKLAVLGRNSKNYSARKN